MAGMLKTESCRDLLAQQATFQEASGVFHPQIFHPSLRMTAKGCEEITFQLAACYLQASGQIPNTISRATRSCLPVNYTLQAASHPELRELYLCRDVRVDDSEA